MKIVGVVAEYNPFHFGHKYHLDASMKKTKADYSVAVMSGSFLQRGEPSFIDKWSRAKMAIENGVDLVIELPFIYATQSAEFFAYGAVKLLDSLKVINYISFGSEVGEIEELSHIATLLSLEPKDYLKNLKSNLSKGLSFSVSRSNAIEDYLCSQNLNTKTNYNKILKQSNNILGIEYLKAIKKINSSIIPITVKRFGSEYNDLHLDKGFASATAIRHTISNSGLVSAKNIIPLESYKILCEYVEIYNKFNYLNNYEEILIYLLRTASSNDIKRLLNIETGLENRIIEKSFKSNDIDEIINSITSKRYPRTRIQRVLIHLINELYSEDFNLLKEIYPSYIRVLATNKNGFTILNKIKEQTNVPIITKFADYKNLKDEKVDKIIYYDKKSTDIFFLGIEVSKVLSNMDYYTSPYIK